MSDQLEGGVSQDTDERTLWERYCDANQAYIVLGVAHFALIGPGFAAAGLRDGGHPVLTAIGGMLVGLVFLLLFFHLAEYHGEAGDGSGKLVSEAGRNG